MALPSMPTGVVSREELRVADGYGAAAVGQSPAGGLDIDNEGNLATDGDFTLAGEMDVVGGTVRNSTGNLTLDAYSASANTTIYLKNTHATYKAAADVEGDLAVHGNVTSDGNVHAVTNVAADNGTDKVVVKVNSIELTRASGSSVYIDSMTNGNTVRVRTSNVSQRDTTALSLDPAGNANIAGDFNADGGDLVGGSSAAVRGMLTVWHGSGGSAPGCLKLASRNGTVWYLFVTDSGTLRVHNALPANNTDGTAIGTQT